MRLTEGQALALEQLEEVATLSRGEFELLSLPKEVESGSVLVDLALRTRPFRTRRGMSFRDRERLRIYIPAEFPFRRPHLQFAHTRFKGEPHVQWGNSICLHQAPEAEWQPSDGMYGFCDRMHDWFAAAGAGQLDPDDAPLHPPVIYSGTDLCVVAQVDAPAITSGVPWLGRANMQAVGERRLDLVGWTALSEWEHNPARETSDAFALVLPRALPLEFPTKVWELTKALRNAGADLAFLLPALRLTALSTLPGRPALMVIGAPMRRRAAGEPLRQHLTAWRLDGKQVDLLRAYALKGGELEVDAVVEWMVGASVEWCRVLEDRPEIVNRRDERSPASWVRGRRVLLLGCGALGSSVAELLVRAGAASLTLVDNGLVKPGILVRQRYADPDIGNLKSYSLQDRLRTLGLGCEVAARYADLAKEAALKGEEEFDLVVDATASRSVAHRLEQDLATSGLACPLLALAVSAGAQHGSVLVRMPGSRHGPVGLARMAKLAALSRDAGHLLVDAFWPKDPPDMLQPEPGCSEPTFSGSAADVDHHAAGLLNVGLCRIATLEDDGASMDLLAASWVDLPARTFPRLRYSLPSWRHLPEEVHGFTTFVSPVAWRGVEAEIRRIARTRSDHVETGGLMLGEVDEAHRTIWIDGVTGPPPDSESSSERFVCGVEGTQDIVGRAAAASGSSSRFVGIWHTHPVSNGRPSDVDMRAMVHLLLLQERPPRRTAMLIVGHSATEPQPTVFLFRRQDIRIEVVAAGECG